MQKVLVIEDRESTQSIYQDILGKKVELVQAFTIAQAEELFAAHPDVDVILMDACVPGSDPTTIPLTKKIRETFHGPMIATSSVRSYRELLKEAGCDHEGSDVWKVRDKVLEVLGI